VGTANIVDKWKTTWPAAGLASPRPYCDEVPETTSRLPQLQDWRLHDFHDFHDWRSRRDIWIYGCRVFSDCISMWARAVQGTGDGV